MKKLSLLFSILFLLSCQPESKLAETSTAQSLEKIIATSLVILGNVQDAGAPHIGCTKACCQALFTEGKSPNKVISLGLYDASGQKQYLFEATPDLPQQLYNFNKLTNAPLAKMPDGIFLTHAHIGHYTGLMYLGKEAKAADSVAVYTMPRMKSFLASNGPWSPLVNSGNIKLTSLENEVPISLGLDLQVIPILVPHRDEYSETVGFKIIGPDKSALFIPDIDKWDKWSKDILAEIKQVDYAFLDAAFFSGKEINNRDISQIPHPFVVESLEKFKSLSLEERQKVIFIHFNHTNPVLNSNSQEAQEVLNAGYKLGQLHDVFSL